MPEPRVAFQGEMGAYSQAAAEAHFEGPIRAVPCRTLDGVFDVTEAGDAEFGLIPIENALAGSIHRSYDLLLQHELRIVGEHYQRIRHHLMALQGVGIADIVRVHSHPQALAQCGRYLGKHSDWELVPSYDTAGSARRIQNTGDRQAAAIASEQAADLYALKVLAHGIEDNPANFTRFLALAREPAAPGANAKTSIVFSLENQPGALVTALGLFSAREIDLTKIESRPLSGSPGEYLFYLGLAGSAADSHVATALNELDRLSMMYRTLGSYPREDFTTAGVELPRESG